MVSKHRHRSCGYLSHLSGLEKEKYRIFFFTENYTIFNLKCSFDPIFQDYHFETRHKVEIPSALNT